MGSILTAFWTAITTSVENLPNLIKTMFENLLWVDPTATTKVLSDFSQFSLIFLGLSLCLGIGKFLVSMIRRKI